jgi:esterase
VKLFLNDVVKIKQIMLTKVNRCLRPFLRRGYAIDLNFTRIQNTETKGPTNLPPLVIIHGLFGSGNNFATVAKQLNQDVYLLDIRNHGNSPHDEDMKLTTMADDLEHFLEKNNLNQIDLFGFSMGGKIAMTSALRDPQKMEKIVRKLIIGDISPLPITNAAHWDIPQVMDALMQVDKHLPQMDNRKEADDILKRAGLRNTMVNNFLLSNLLRVGNSGPNKYKWRFNLHALHDNLPTMASFPYHPPNINTNSGILNKNQFHNPTLFIKGERSNLIPEESLPIINAFFPNHKLVEFPNAGHWIHTENPKLFDETLKNFLEK